MRGEPGIQAQAETGGGLGDGFPAGLGVGTEFLTFNEGDALVAQLLKMAEGEFGGALVIEKDVADAVGGIVSGNGEDGDGEVVTPGSVDGDQSIDEAAHEELGIFLDEIGAVVVAGDQIEIALFQKMVFDAAHDEGGVTFADLGDEDSDGETALGAGVAGGETGTVIEFAGGGENAFLGGAGDGVGDAGAVEDQRNGGWGQPEMVGKQSEGDTPGAVVCFAGGAGGFPGR